jgi:hypothetical protein
VADYLEEVDHVAARILKLEKSIDEAVQQAPAEIKAVMEALRRSAALRRQLPPRSSPSSARCPVSRVRGN